MLSLLGLGVASCLELLLWWSPLWKRRKAAAPAVLALVTLATAWLAAINPAAWASLISLFSLYRCVNLGRVAADRIQPDYLFHSSRQTSLWLIGLQAATAAIAGLNRAWGPASGLWWWGAAALISLGCAIVLLVSTLRHLRTTKPPQLTQKFADAQLPALSVAIPARNETTDLEECLQSLLASTYPKLEILVLDDCSQNKRTPEIIRGFAHAGVRFIAGKEPPDSWLAKNYAYTQLAAAANGDVLLFCGVDTRFSSYSLDVLVKTLLQKRKNMLSVLPRNAEPRAAGLTAWFMQSNRYAWELALPRRLLRRPAVLSTCWLITRAALQAAGGFEAARRKGVPESYLARAAAANDGYSFMQADESIGVSSQKTADEQRATAIRTRYLQLHRRPEFTAAVSLAEFSVLLLPPIMLLVSAVNRHWLIAAMSGLSLVINIVIYTKLINLTYRRFLVRGLWLLPVAALYDIGLLNYSMWQHEFREVLWKGRNVCIPVMRVIAKLPEPFKPTRDSAQIQ